MFVIGLSLVFMACNGDNTAPIITITQDTFCTSPGGVIELSVMIEEENNLEELRLSASDLDFMETIDGNIIQENDGLFNAGFTVHPDTPAGTYDLNIQAVDDSENVSTGTVTIKVQT